MAQAVIVLGQGGHNLRANRRLRALAETLATQVAPTIQSVVPAYLTAGTHGATPSFGDAVERLIQEGADDLIIVPFLAEWPYPEHIDVSDFVRDLATEYPAVRFRLGQVLGTAPGVVEVLKGQVEAAQAAPAMDTLSERERAELTEQTPITTASFREGATPNLPPQAQHLLLCAGRRCSELGSADLYRDLSEQLAEHGLDTGPQRVKLTRTKCLGPCAAAPVACLYPRGTYFAGLERDLVPAFVEDVLVAGGTLAGHTFEPQPAPPAPPTAEAGQA